MRGGSGKRKRRHDCSSPLYWSGRHDGRSRRISALFAVSSKVQKLSRLIAPQVPPMRILGLSLTSGSHEKRLPGVGVNLSTGAWTLIAAGLESLDAEFDTMS